MDAVYVILSSSLLSANIISLLDVLIAIGIFIILFGTVKAVVLSRNKDELSSRKKLFIRRQESLVHEQQLRQVSHKIIRIVNNLINTQYVVNDRKEYASMLQTPLRDNLKQLRSIASELNAAGYIPKPQPKHALGAAYANIKVNSAFIMADILPALKNLAQDKGMHLDVREFAHAQLTTPFGLVDKMLRELLLNAIVHNPEGTTIRLRCNVCAQQAVFEIIDDGVGIPADYMQVKNAQDVLLKPQHYRRLCDAETHLNIQAISLLAEHYSGELAISSALRLGTHVRLILPCSDISKIPKLPQSKLAPSHFDKSSRKRLMLIGHHTHALKLLTTQFADMYSTLCYKSFDSALRDIIVNKPDIVVADFSWQDALGIQLCSFLRASKQTTNIPLIMVTTAIDQSTRVKAYSSGVSAIVQKPLDLDELDVVVNNLLQKKELMHTTMHIDESSDGVSESDSDYQGLIHSDNRKQDFAKQLHSYVLEHYKDEEFNGKDVAESMNVSEKTLQRRMKKYLDKDFSEYLRRFRLDKAKTQLVSGSNITRVAFENGFNSTSYFGQCFKQEYGYPPSQLTKIQA
jgi:AraC-like DNA-binding protein